MIKKHIVYIAASASMILLLFGCNAPEVQPTADSVKKPETTAHAITDVSQPDDKGYYTCEYNGVQRKYILYIPEGVGENAPLVLMLHGYADTSKNFMDYTGMNSVAEAYGFAVVYPQGIHSGTNGACWNSGPTKYGNVDIGNDDIGFLVALAKYLQQINGFSSSETFAAGFSNGAYMMYKLACEAPDTFRAVASVAGSMSVGAWEERPKSVSIGILQINGTKDNAAPIRDPASPADFGGSPDIKGVIEYWKNANNLGELQKVRLSDSATAYEYSGRQNGNLVWYVEIEGFGHDWPKEDTAGFNASEEIIRFFSNYVG